LTVNSNLENLVGENCKKLLQISKSSCNFLLTTIDDVFDLSKMELNQFSLKNEWFYLEEVFSEVKSILGVQCEIKKISLEFEAEQTKLL